MNEGFEYRAQVNADGDGVAVLEYLTRRYPKSSREEWSGRIRAGRVLLDGTPVLEEALLKAGQSIVWVRPAWEEPRVPLSFAVLYDQAGVLAVAKPPGLPTMPGGGRFVDHTLLAIVRRRFPAASPLHRLGRATSGVVLFSTASAMYAAIAAQWRSGRILKVYRALVAGHPATDRFSVDVPIGPLPHPILGSVHAACDRGKRALSDVTVLERRQDSSLVEVRITTGRPHQIRIHLAAAGHPLAGDPLYLPGGVPDVGTRALPGDPGYLLHAALLGFTHPATGGWTEVECLPPPALRVSRP